MQERTPPCDKREEIIKLLDRADLRELDLILRFVRGLIN